MKDQVRRAIENLLNSEDNTGCCEDLTVVSMEAIWNLRELMRKSKDEISVTWCIHDVIGAGKEIGYDITEDQARDILAEIKRKYDASVGLNWETIKIQIDVTDMFLGGENKLKKIT